VASIFSFGIETTELHTFLFLSVLETNIRLQKRLIEHKAVVTHHDHNKGIAGRLNPGSFS